MPVSAFDLFKIGIGPSSSHTVGPMRIALEFVRQVERERTLAATAAVEVHLYGSLALTGRGHATDRAVMLGLMGHEPERQWRLGHGDDQSDSLVGCARVGLRICRVMERDLPAAQPDLERC